MSDIWSTVFTGFGLVLGGAGLVGALLAYRRRSSESRKTAQMLAVYLRALELASSEAERDPRLAERYRRLVREALVAAHHAGRRDWQLSRERRHVLLKSLEAVDPDAEGAGREAAEALDILGGEPNAAALRKGTPVGC